MMTRRALLIVCPGINGASGYLPGTLIDLENYYQFLYSKIGGDWFDSEITKLVNPTIEDVLKEISRIDQSYSLLYTLDTGAFRQVIVNYILN